MPDFATALKFPQMEQLLEFIGNHRILTGAFAVVLAAVVATEAARLFRRWKEIETSPAIRLINREDPLILDVSNSTDYAKSHILNAEHMPPSRLEAGNGRLLKQQDRPVLVYCRNGQVSPQMATRLTRMGFGQVYLLKGGLAQWISDGQPTTRPGGRKAGKKESGGKRGGKSAQNKGAGKGEKAGRRRQQESGAREPQSGAAPSGTEDSAPGDEAARSRQPVD